MKALLLTASLVLLASTGCKSASKADTSLATEPTAPAYFKVDTATAGDVHGTVTYKGPARTARPAAIDMSSDPACASAHTGKAFDDSLVVSKKGELANAFVYISKGLEGKVFQVPEKGVTIDQKGCWFTPRVLGMQTGGTLDIVNSDPVTHNIHPVSVGNREWNHSQGPGDAPMHHKFTKQEVMIPVKCNIHNWMHAWIGVVDSPYFAVTGDDGTFDLPNLPPGTYTVTAWHEGLDTQQSTVTIPSNGKVSADLQFHAK